VTAVFCPRPNLKGSSCKSPRCPVCGPRWVRDWRRSMTVNLGHYGRDVVMISITPPGADRLPWDEQHCDHPRGGRHDGKRGCRVQQRAAREWTETATQRYAGLRRAAAIHVRRHAPRPVNLLERVWEPQKRGVPHLHLVVGAGSPAELRAAAEFVAKLKELAPEWDFGFVDARGRKKSKGRRVVVGGQVLKLIAPAEAARYLASYLSGRSKSKPSIRENLEDPAIIHLLETRRIDRRRARRRMTLPLVWLTPRLTSARFGGTGVTMRTLRRARHLWVWAKGFVEEGPQWRDLAEAVIVGATYRRAYGRRGEDDEPPPVEPALRLVEQVSRRLELMPRRGYFRALQDREVARFANELALSVAGLVPEPGPLMAVQAEAAAA
jgi:hypothetical protein